MEHKDDADDLHENHHDAIGLARVRHHQEDAENVDGQQWDDDPLNGLADNCSELCEHIVQRRKRGIGYH